MDTKRLEIRATKNTITPLTKLKYTVTQSLNHTYTQRYDHLYRKALVSKKMSVSSTMTYQAQKVPIYQVENE